jgi:hypothetical protein
MFKTVAEWLKQDKNAKPEGNDANELAQSGHGADDRSCQRRWQFG